MIPEWLTVQSGCDYYLVGDPDVQVIVELEYSDDSSFDFNIWDAETGDFYNGGSYAGISGIENQLTTILAFTLINSDIFKKIA